MNRYLAFDLGAESGRAILGTLDGGKLELELLHRFPNTPVRLPTGLYWDTLRLFHEMQAALRICGRERRLTLDGIGIDTWGVDFALLGRDGELTGNPRHYRDARNEGMLERTLAAVSRVEIFANTGIQFMAINSLCQLYGMKLAGSPALDAAHTLLFMPDLFNYWLTGVTRCELSIASTSQFYNPETKKWAVNLFEKLGLPVAILPEIVEPGAELGPLLPEAAADAGLEGRVPVYATACHDTASAVAAAPAEGQDWCYISSGTWSLMGVEIDEPVIDSKVLSLNFTNEMGAGGKVRLLKNIAGLWVLQECRRAWALGGYEYSYEELARMAAAAPPTNTTIDVDEFRVPGRMPEQIAAYCRSTGQAVPEQPGPMCRVILTSLALSYKKVLDGLEKLLERRIGVIHIVGGGSRNELLNQLTADVTGRTVVAGPAEATAAGNILVQAIGAGRLSGLAEARRLVRDSFALKVYEPSSL